MPKSMDNYIEDGNLSAPLEDSSPSNAKASGSNAQMIKNVRQITEKTMLSASDIKKIKFGYNKDGTCGILASSMLLTYSQKYNRNLVPSNLMPQFDTVIPDDKESSKQNILHKYLLDQYAYEEFFGGTTQQIDERMLNIYIGTEAKYSSMHAISNFGMLGIEEAIDSNTPVAVYGLLPDKPSVTKGRDSVAHSVVAYGYRKDYFGITHLKVHYGWHGDTYIDNDYTSSQETYDIWIAPYAVSGSLRLENTTNHSHSAYRMTSLTDKNGDQLFACKESSCNALIADDYSNFVEQSQRVVLINDSNGHPYASFLGKINYAEDYDYFQLDIPHKGRVTVQADFGKEDMKGMTIYNQSGYYVGAAGSVPGSNNKSIKLSDYLLEPGTYYIRIHGRTKDNYKLNISLTSKDDYGDTFNDAEIIRLDGNNHLSLKGKSNYNGDYDYFKIEIPHKGKITVQADYEKADGKGLQLYDQSGRYRGAGGYVAGSNNKSVKLTDYLLEPGTYYIRMYGQTEDNYKLNIELR